MGRVFCYVSVILAAKVVEGNVQCDMYMSYVDGFGVGVYAGRAYSPDEILEVDFDTISSFFSVN